VKKQDMQEQQAKLIDIEKVFADKNPRLLNSIPKFVIRYLKRIIHQDELNTFVAQNADKQGAPFAQAFLDQCRITVESNGLDQIHNNGRYIFVANHPWAVSTA
jgi:hypothetical protein